MLEHSKRNLAADVRLSFVQSLYTKRSTLFVGMVSHLLVALMVFHSTGQLAFLIFGIGVFTIWALRIYDMAQFDKVDLTSFTLNDTQKWETRYVVGAVSITLLLGVMTAYAFVLSESDFAKIATISVTFATLVAVVGRNFGSKINVDMMVLAVCLPVLVGFIFSNDIYIQVFAVLLLPVFLATRSMANGVRDFLYSSVMSQKETSILADRFDGAINNMSHGLVMVDPDHQVAVINDRAVQMFSIPNGIDPIGLNFQIVLRYGLQNGSFTKRQIKKVADEMDSLILGKVQKMRIDVDRDFFLECSARHQKDGNVVVLFEDVTEKVLSDEKILHMARYDGLTNLPNRDWFSRLVLEKLESAQTPKYAGLAVFDIIDFKHVNDTKGHTVGDLLLSAVATRLNDFAPEEVIVSRFGGDEFVAFFTSDDDAHIKATMEKLFHALCRQYVLDGEEFSVSFIAGLAVEGGDHCQVEALHICADIAMHEARKHGKNRWLCFEKSMDNQHSERQKLKMDLQKALAEDQLSVAYQPIFTPDGNKIVGAEALSRWNHADLGPVSPAIYIPLAEELGIIKELTCNMINRAAKDCKKFPGDMFVSVNLSGHDIVNNDIIDVISKALEVAQLAPERLHLEVTESALVDDFDHAAELLGKLGDRGMSIAIDDFGTGYSSLSYLDKLPLNKIKIDRSFVKNITVDERKVRLLRGIVNMSRELGLVIITEGIETDEQLDLVCKNGCADFIQGYIFGMPMPCSALVELSKRLNRTAKRQLSKAI